MENHSQQLNDVFHSLADPTRRGVLSRLGRGPATISELAAPVGMALPSFLKHIRSLEGSGLIRTRKVGRVRTCSIERKTFALVDDWLAAQRAIWEGRADRLEQFVMSEQAKEEYLMTEQGNEETVTSEQRNEEIMASEQRNEEIVTSEQGNEEIAAGKQEEEEFVASKQAEEESE